MLRPIIGPKKDDKCGTPNCTADAHNAYYVSVGPTTAASVPALQTVLSVIVPRVLSCTFHVGTVNADTLYGTIQNVKLSSFLGLDGIT